MITEEHKMIIADAVDSALAFGTGLLTACKESLEEEDIEFTDEHEKYVFDTYIDQ
jgi:hypothetical protein